ncbi:MAG: TonB-dependent receptor [Bacteroidetes bacterium]|nr:TonB-dependent receptor [Bacteroidota bacterium]
MKSFILFLSMALPSIAMAQTLSTIRGSVYEMNGQSKEFLTGVNIVVVGTTEGSTSDSSGSFEINTAQEFPVRLAISYVGYSRDTFKITEHTATQVNIELKKSITLKEAIVEGRIESTAISTLTPINTTTITSGELLKAACCNLSESFETNPVVDVNQTDAVTGAKQIQMLGLDGIYTQIQSENVPLIRGLSAAYGLGFTPGPWIESIQINKGVGSVINGYEGITGQLNIELKKPQTAEAVFINGYVNHEGREELNIQLANRFKKNTSGELLLHGSTQVKKVDHNGDGFLDQPLYQQLNAYNRWHFGIPNKLEAQVGLRALYDDKQGGQNRFNYSNDFGKQTNYGVGINNKLIELFTKTGTINAAKPYKSFALITSTRLHLQDSYFGLKTYSARQESFYANTIYQTIISDTRHYIRGGLSFNYNNYFEKINGLPLRTQELVPGAYAEYTYNDLQQFSLVAGVREDYHNSFGFYLTPRLHLKYNFTQLTSLRLSGGRGWRTARVYAENTGAFASSRTINAAMDLRPEVAWNSGINFTHKFRLFAREAVFNVDYYYTFFENQVVLDMEEIHEIRFYNLNGKSYAHYVQGEITTEPIPNFTVLLAYKHNETATNYSGTLRQRPFVPRDKGLLNVEYKTKNKKWSMNATAKVFGYSRIPSGGIIHHGNEIPLRSKPYSLYAAQVSYFLMRFDVYVGAENIGNFTQHNPIIDAESPFSSSFDASLVWGPLMGRLMYIGFRWKPFSSKK